MEYNPNDLIVTEKPKHKIITKKNIKKKSSHGKHENTLINFIFKARKTIKNNIANFFRSKYIYKK